MNTELARSLVSQRHDELTAHASQPSRAVAEPLAAAIPAQRRRHMPRWRLNWTRETLAPSDAVGRTERSWVIIISATTRGA
jgi:hypothetical protein